MIITHSIMNLAFMIDLGGLDSVPIMDTEIDFSFPTIEDFIILGIVFIIHGVITRTTLFLLLIPIWGMSMDTQIIGRRVPIDFGIHIPITDMDGGIQ